MTPQCEILTEMQAFTTEAGIVCNPFYRKTEEFVRKNLQAAKKYYPRLFNDFVTFWLMRQLREKGMNLDEIIALAPEKILRALETGELKRVPRELEELVV